MFRDESSGAWVVSVDDKEKVERKGELLPALFMRMTDRYHG
jgi:hypothetical protein